MTANLKNLQRLISVFIFRWCLFFFIGYFRN